MERLLFLPSTPLNVLVSSALAIQWQSEFEMELWLIDQKKVFDNPYYQALLNWKDSPFGQVQVFSGNARGRAKIKERQENFEKLRLSVDRFEPDKIAAGSDRRVEFQYLLHYLRQKGKEVKGLYLDDGLYSYSGRKSHFFKDSLNAWLKKLAYGRWWEEPSTVGASSLIDEAWLFQPSLVVKALSEKPCFKLQADWFKSPSLTGLSDALAQTLNVDTQGVAKLDVLILIPHPNNIKKIHGYEKRIKALVGELSRKGKKVGVKYHPRMQQEDALGLKEYG
ncbi:hypothetical protein, partial [Thiomicrorhabdus sp.]|uniref:hypothetical protein n=1 Tax=Thiomicrorhabdus sp. TaxID=2039724 RepID=UPI0035674C07